MRLHKLVGGRVALQVLAPEFVHLLSYTQEFKLGLKNVLKNKESRQADLRSAFHCVKQDLLIGTQGKGGERLIDRALRHLDRAHNAVRVGVSAEVNRALIKSLEHFREPRVKRCDDRPNFTDPELTLLRAHPLRAGVSRHEDRLQRGVLESRQ